MTFCRVLERPVMFAVVAKRSAAATARARVAVSIGVGGEPAMSRAVGIAARTLGGQRRRDAARHAQHRLDRVPERDGGLEAEVAVLLQAAQHDLIDHRRDVEVGAPPAGRHGRLRRGGG